MAIKNMTIPIELLNVWKELRSPGDASDMADKLPGTDKETFNRAFRLGRCREDVYQTMLNFYKDKSERIKQSMKDLKNALAD